MNYIKIILIIFLNLTSGKLLYAPWFQSSAKPVETTASTAKSAPKLEPNFLQREAIKTQDFLAKKTGMSNKGVIDTVARTGKFKNNSSESNSIQFDQAINKSQKNATNEGLTLTDTQPNFLQGKAFKKNNSENNNQQASGSKMIDSASETSLPMQNFLKGLNKDGTKSLSEVRIEIADKLQILENAVKNKTTGSQNLEINIAKAKKAIQVIDALTAVGSQSAKPSEIIISPKTETSNSPSSSKSPSQPLADETHNNTSIDDILKQNATKLSTEINKLTNDHNEVSKLLQNSNVENLTRELTALESSLSMEKNNTKATGTPEIQAKITAHKEALQILEKRSEDIGTIKNKIKDVETSIPREDMISLINNLKINSRGKELIIQELTNSSSKKISLQSLEAKIENNLKSSEHLLQQDAEAAQTAGYYERGEATKRLVETRNGLKELLPTIREAMQAIDPSYTFA